jgi:hypothetical protein
VGEIVLDGDAAALTPEIERHGHEGEDAHEHAKDAKRLGGPGLVNPGADKKGPGKGDDGADDANDGEAVASDGAVGIADLLC